MNREAGSSNRHPLARRSWALGLALATLAVLTGDLVFEWLDHRPGGRSFRFGAQPVLMGLFAVATIATLRWRRLGGALASFCTGGLIVFATEQLVAAHAAVVIVGFALPTVWWFLADIAQRSAPARSQDTPTQSTRRSVVGRRWLLVRSFAIASVAALGGGWAGRSIHQAIFGPTHPGSATDLAAAEAVQWAWAGGLTQRSAEVVAKVTGPAGALRVVGPDGSQRLVPPVRTIGDIAQFAVDGLRPDTTYRYAVADADTVDTARAGRFTTFPEGAGSFTLAFASCARTGSNGAVFDRIREAGPLLYTNLGDFHYGDVADDDSGEFAALMDITLSRPAQSALYRSTGVEYVWDDHDFGGLDRDSRGRPAAFATYRSHVPSRPLPHPDVGLFRSFDIGRIRMIITDCRAARTPAGHPDGPAKSMLGPLQRDWLIEELSSVGDAPLVIWVNPVPWIADVDEGADHWGGYATERAAISEAIARLAISDRLLMVSGDAHMVGLDDGTNSDYSSAGGAGFPVFHVAALDKTGEVKGGPYSHGAFPGGGQFGLVEILDDGPHLAVSLQGRSWDGRAIVDYQLELAGRTVTR
ncbi:MAG: alkaline phosphatase D family protein [Acidimicrobiales bacterium]